MADDNLALAKKYEKMAREQTNLMSDMLGELKNKVKASQEMQAQLDARLQSDEKLFLYTVTKRDAMGRIAGELFGNGIITQKFYDPVSGKLTSIKTDKGKTTLRELQYTYDDMNNVLTREDSTTGNIDSFTYDEYDRLLSWDNGNKTLSYSYDNYGNLKNNYFNRSMSYNDKNQLISKIDNNLISDTEFQYDANGNQLQDKNKTMSYTPFNKIKTITQKKDIQLNGRTFSTDLVTTLKYDSFNNLVQKTVGNKVTIYVTPEYEYVINKQSDSNSTIDMVHNLINDKGKIVATHTKSLKDVSIEENQTVTELDGTKMVDRTQYIHKDALGSTDFVTDSQGEIALRYTYSPFGAVISIYERDKELYSFLNLRGYTGHRHHYEHNLVNMNGRTYDPTTSRFTSPDPHVTYPTMAQNFNRYAYVYNNPLKYIDPTGYDGLDGGCDDDDGGFGDDDDGGLGDDSDGDGDDWTSTTENGIEKLTNPHTGEHFTIDHNNGTYSGEVGGYSYTGGLDGSFATNENLETGEFNAWGTDAYGKSYDYRQHANGITSSLSYGNYRSFSIGKFTVSNKGFASNLRNGAAITGWITRALQGTPLGTLSSYVTFGTLFVADLIDPTQLDDALRNGLIDYTTDKLPGGVVKDVYLDSGKTIMDHYSK